MGLFDLFLKPADTPYNALEWEQLPFPEQARLSCQAWYQQGFGSPGSTLAFYVIKMALWIWLFVVFCSYSVDLGTFSSISEWWYKPEAFGKLILWTSMLEVLGLGGGCGPLTGRFVPPFGASTYFLRPKTIKLPLFPDAPVVGGDTRNLIDVAAYGLLLAMFLRACLAPALTFDYIWPVLAFLLICGLLDRTIYLAARADVYFPMIACYLFIDQTVPAMKICLFAVWFWAAFAKLTPNFTYVVCTMICNSPIFRHFTFFRKALFRNAPDDLRPSQFANGVAHFGTLIEFSLPLLLLFSGFLDAGVLYYILIGITLFHIFILVNIPLGVPMEWNVVMIYGAWAIFGMHPTVSAFSVTHPFLIVLFVILFFVVIVIGTFWPRHVSFLMCMRYYAGTWGYSIWLFKEDANARIEDRIVKSSKSFEWQLSLLYGSNMVKGILSRMMGFRLMHLPGQAVNQLYSKATNDQTGYQWMDGETVCGEVLGWNFGDAHLHNERLLRSMQKRCVWAPGDVRVIMVESPQLHTGRLHYRIVDAHDGLLEEGGVFIRDLKHKHPWSSE